MTRRQSVRTGVLFIVATASVLAGNALSTHGRVVAELVAAVSSAGIAASLFTALGSLGPGAVAFRSIEGVLYAIGAFALLSPHAGALREHAILGGVFAFCAGATLYYVSFFRSRVVPRWLSLWGIVGTALMSIACVLSLESGAPITSHVLLALPIAVQEMVLAVWLIASPRARPA